MRRRFQVQLGLFSTAIILVAAARFLLIGDAIRGAEGMVVSQAAGSLAAAVTELAQLNAVEAMPSGGTIGVGFGGDAKWVAVRVSNSGAPLSAAEQEGLFEMFYSTKPEGSGLGLAVSRQIVERMGGVLDYDAASPVPAFVVRLPRARL